MELKEKIAYLQGLAAGLNLDDTTKEGKMFIAIMDILDDMAQAIEDLASDQDDLEEYIEAVDEDLGELEDDVYGDDDDDDDDDYFCDCCSDDDEDFEEGTFVEVECPKCHDIVRFEASILEDEDVIEVTCPNCDEIVYVNDETLSMDDE